MRNCLLRGKAQSNFSKYRIFAGAASTNVWCGFLLFANLLSSYGSYNIYVAGILVSIYRYCSTHCPKAGQTVFNEVIDESSSPSDCETVKNYYQAFVSLKRIRSVYILIEKKAVKQGKITVLGTLAYSTLQANPESVITAGSLSVEDLRQFKTKEYEKDDSTGSYVAVKGSMDNVPFEYCLEYCQEYVAKRLKQPFSDKDKAAIPVFIAPHKKIYRVAAMQSLKP